MKTEILRGNDAFASIGDDWNQLWESSQCQTASARAETLLNFAETFSPDVLYSIIAVRDHGGRLVAGLPLLISRRQTWIRSAELAVNEWSQCGRLLVSESCDNAEVISHLVDGARRLRVGNLWLDWTRIDDPALKLFASRSQDEGWGVQVKERFEVGVTRLPESWEAYEQTFNKNNRRKLRTELKQLQFLGEVELEVHKSLPPPELDAFLDVAMQIEMQGWKGKEGTAMKSDPVIAGYFRRWAGLLNDAGLLRLFFLKLNGQRIAFDLGAASHGTYVSQKVSYLPEFTRNSPGHVLNGLVNRHFIESGTVHTIDTVGPMTEANRRWSNDSYRSGRVVIAPGSWLSNTTGRSIVTLLNAKSVIRGIGEATESA